MSRIELAWRDATREERIAFVCVAIAAGISLFFSLAGYPAVGHDADVHLNWLDQFPRIHDQGITFPRWLPLSNGGFGSPTFYFYPPLPYWIASFFHLFLPFVPSPFYNLMALLATLGSVVTCWLLVRQYSTRPIATATAVLTYGFLAYHFADVFVRDALGEHWAMMVLPLVFIRLRDRVQSIALFAIAWSALLLTSIPITALALASVCVQIIVERKRSLLIDHALSFALAIGVSVAYLLPATLLRPLIHAEHLWDIRMQTSGFILLDLFGHRGWLRFLALATLVAGAVICVSSRRNRTVWFWIALVAVVLQIPIFAPLWHLHLLSFVQFSWRWNAVLLLAFAVMIASTRGKINSYLAIGLALVTIVGGIRLSSEFFLHRQLPFDRYRLDAPEYHPRWITNDTTEVKALAHIRIDEAPAILMGLTSPGDSIQLISYRADAKTFHVHLERPASAKFHLFYWPYWAATADSKPITLSPDPNGIAIANLPAGDYRMTLLLVQSKAETIGNIISLIGLLSLIGLISIAAYRERTTRLEMTSEPT